MHYFFFSGEQWWKMGENISLTFQHMGFKLKDVLQVLQVAGEQLDGICQISLSALDWNRLCHPKILWPLFSPEYENPLQS
jgi:hypothetical protein